MHVTTTATATAVIGKSSVISSQSEFAARPVSRRMPSNSAAARTKRSTYNSNRSVGGSMSKSRHSTGSDYSGSKVYGIAMHDRSSSNNHSTEVGASGSDSTIAATHSEVDVVIRNDGIDIPVIDPLISSSGEKDAVLTPLLVPQSMDTVESTHNTTNTARYPTLPLGILVEAVNIRSTISAMSNISNSDRVAKRVRRSSSGMSLSSTIDDTTVGASASVGIGDLCIATATTATSGAKSMQNIPLHVYEERVVEVFDPETFHSLESDTFNYIVEQLQLYYTHTGKYLHFTLCKLDQHV